MHRPSVCNTPTKQSSKCTYLLFLSPFRRSVWSLWLAFGFGTGFPFGGYWISSLSLSQLIHVLLGSPGVEWNGRDRMCKHGTTRRLTLLSTAKALEHLGWLTARVHEHEDQCIRNMNLLAEGRTPTSQLSWLPLTWMSTLYTFYSTMQTKVPKQTNELKRDSTFKHPQHVLGKGLCRKTVWLPAGQAVVEFVILLVH